MLSALAHEKIPVVEQVGVAQKGDRTVGHVHGSNANERSVTVGRRYCTGGRSVAEVV